jgi:oligoendopeptidase F
MTSRKPALLISRGVTLLLILSMSPWSVFCQETFEPIPPQLAPLYHLDFARNFFASPEAERTERAKLYATLRALESLRGKAASSANALEQSLQLYNSAQVEFRRHYAYLYLRYAVNTADRSSLTESNALNAEVSTRTGFLQQELMRMDERALAAFVVQRPALKQHLFFIETVRRYRDHMLSLQEEELLSATAPLGNDWQAELYDRLRSRIKLNPPDNSNPKAREEGFKQLFSGLAAQRDLYAFTLIRLATARDTLARLRKFADAPGEAYFNSYWSKEEVDDLLEQIAGHADLYKRYQRLRASHAGKITGSAEVKLWDMSVRAPGMQVPRYSIAEASRIIRAALAPLGPEYSTELAALLDPANGRLDIVPGEHRKRGGFSQGFVGTDSVFYSGGFTGYYNDVRVLTHESTHAVHRQLMNRNRVLPSYAEGPHYLFEAFAIFSEFLLPDYLYGHEADPLRRQYYLEQFLDGKGMEMFIVAPEVAVEHAVYDGVRRGTIKGADELDALTKRIYSRYSIWPERQDELKMQWMNISLMYEDPFYDINYVYGALLALKFYEMYTRDPQHFVPRYVALMRNGFDAPPAILLKRFLGINLNDPHLIRDALRVLEDKVNLLEKSYQ